MCSGLAGMVRSRGGPGVSIGPGRGRPSGPVWTGAAGPQGHGRGGRETAQAVGQVGARHRGQPDPDPEAVAGQQAPQAGPAGAGPRARGPTGACGAIANRPAGGSGSPVRSSGGRRRANVGPVRRGIGQQEPRVLMTPGMEHDQGARQGLLPGRRARSAFSDCDHTGTRARPRRPLPPRGPIATAKPPPNPSWRC